MSAIRILFKILSYIIPVSKKIYVFHSFPFYTDNSYAIYQYIRKNYKVNCIWLVDSKEELQKVEPCERPKHVYLRYSIKGFWYFFRAKFIFCTHGIFNTINLYQNNKIINMWHGMPLKKIGSMDAEFGGENPTRADYLVATSKKFQDIMSCSFGNMDKTRVLITGQPRNDLLFDNTDFFEKHNIERLKYKKVGIWLPTYRKSYVGDVRQDGAFVEEGISFLTFDQLAQLNDFLKMKNDFLIVKLHPMDILQQRMFPSFSNILILKQADLKCQLYPLLGNCDYLLTDYSSVWVDYEIMDKPIGFVMDDIEQYRSSRGFNFDNMDKILPGPILSSLDSLISFCETPEKYNYKRTNLFNEYKDNKSSQRLMEALNKIS